MKRSPPDETSTATPGAPSGQRLWFFRLAAATLVPLLFFLALELVLRWSGYGQPSGFFIAIEGRAGESTNPTFGWRFFPPTLARQPVACDLPTHKEADAYRIFVLGGSAALGVPDPAYSFARVLQVMLQESFSEARFEVINAAMTAINSHVVLPIARDCARRDPDLFIVFMGNNEIVGPYGAGTAFKSFSPHLSLIRGRIWLGGTRLGQLLERLLAGLAPTAETPTGWRGMEMFGDHLLASDDPRLARVYDHFESNLASLLRVVSGAGAEALLSTVAVNLADNAPFASVHRSGLSAADEERWQTAYREGIELASAGDCTAAVERFTAAASLDDRFADLRFRMGRCWLELGDAAAARAHFVAARDEDALRFRAASEINRRIRALASGRESDGVYLVDAVELFDDSAFTSSGIAGDPLFYEHVHMTFAGNYELARGMYERLVELLPATIRGAGAPPPPPALERCAERLAWTDWDRSRMAADIGRLMAGDPFSRQLDFAERQVERRLERERLRRQGTSAAAVTTAAETYRRAIDLWPDDLQLRVGFAELLRRRGDFAAAAEQLETVLARVPGALSWLTELGHIRTDQGELDAAEKLYLQVEAIDPESPTAPYNLGIVTARRERPAVALGYFDAALARDPSHVEARVNRGAALAQLDRAAEALAEYRRAVEIDPGSPIAHFHLGAALAERGEAEAAIGSYREAIRLEPEYALAHYNLGVALAERGERGGAADHYRQAIRIRPDFQRPRDNLADLYAQEGAGLAQRGDLASAIAAFRAAAELRADDAAAQYNLAQALGMAGQTDEAVAALRQALAIDPQMAEAHQQLARVLAAGELPAEALEHARQAVQLRPQWVPALTQLAWLLATRPSGGGADEAIELGERATRLAPGDARAFDVLAAAYAAAGRFYDAVAAAEQAQRLAAAGPPGLSEAIAARLRGYRAGRSFTRSPR